MEPQNPFFVLARLLVLCDKLHGDGIKEDTINQFFQVVSEPFVEELEESGYTLEEIIEGTVAYAPTVCVLQALGMKF